MLHPHPAPTCTAPCSWQGGWRAWRDTQPGSAESAGVATASKGVVEPAGAAGSEAGAPLLPLHWQRCFQSWELLCALNRSSAYHCRAAYLPSILPLPQLSLSVPLVTRLPGTASEARQPVGLNYMLTYLGASLL